MQRRVSHEEHITLVPSEMKNDVDHQMIPRSNDPIPPPEQRTRRTSVPEVRPIRAPEARAENYSVNSKNRHFCPMQKYGL